MESFRCYDNSDVIATLIMTNFRLNTTVIAIFQMFVYGDVVYTQTWYWAWKTVSSHLHMPGRPCCCNVALICFLLFRKNLGNLRDFLGKWFTAPLAKNFPYAYVKNVRVSGWFFQHLHKLIGDIDVITYLKPPDFTNRQILTLICGYGKETFLHHWHISIGRCTCI